jgi:1-acyl-sn-glycerol-3-phosphate acyltransferase
MNRSRQMTSAGDQEAVEAALLDEIAGMLAELRPHQHHSVRPLLEQRLDRELGLDSLSRMELIARLERRFRVRIPDQAGISAETAADLLAALSNAPPRGEFDLAKVAEALSSAMLECPDGADSMVAVLAWHAERHPERKHVRFEGGDADGTTLSYGDLFRASRRFAAGLQAHGLRHSEAVALMLPTHPDFLIAFFGILLAGGVPVPLYPPMRPGDLADYWKRQAGILRNCEARCMLVDSALLGHRRLLRTVTGGVELLTVASLAADDAAPETIVLGASDTVMLQYTSGSTGAPKGVVLSHDNILANLRAMGKRVDVVPSDVFVSWLPLYHDMGLIGAWLGSLYYGIPLVLMPPQHFLLRPERWLWAIHRHRATVSAAPNFAFELCAHRIPESAVNGLDLGSLRLAFCGAEPVFPETLERFATRFAAHGFRRETLYPVYGLAENTLGLAFPPPGRGPRVLHVERDPFIRRGEAVTCPSGDDALAFVSCGLPIDGHELRIADNDDHELADGWQGHVQFRGPSACAGYFRNPDADRALRHGDWHDSGDLGFIHDGELYLSGRVKDLIIRGGRNLHPQAMEQAVGELSGVRRGRVAVFGSVARGTGTEQLVVVAETRLTDETGREALRGRIQDAIRAIASEPADDVVLARPGTLLKTPSGKLRRAACCSDYESGRLSSRRTFALLTVIGRGLWDGLRARGRRLRAWLFAAYAWTVYGVLLVPAGLAVALLPRLEWRWRALRGLLWLLGRACAMEVHVRFRAPMPSPPCIFVANHASYLDPLLAIRVLPRPVAFVAKEELGKQPLQRWLLGRIGAVFVARFDPARCTEVVSEAAHAGGDFLFFPEGTFQRMPGILPFHLGAFRAAVDAGLPIMPIALRGTRSVLRGDERFPRHGRLSAVIGEALRPAVGADPWQETLRLATLARAFLLRECGEPDLQHVASIEPERPITPTSAS